MAKGAGYEPTNFEEFRSDPLARWIESTRRSGPLPPPDSTASIGAGADAVVELASIDRGDDVVLREAELLACSLVAERRSLPPPLFLKVVHCCFLRGPIRDLHCLCLASLASMGACG